MMEQQHGDFDIMEIPLEGVAAYWLSLRKLLGSKRNFKPLEEEAAHTSEPFIRYLLGVATSGSPLSDERFEELARVRAGNLQRTLRRTFDLMRTAIMDAAAGENPRKTLSKMNAQFTVPPLEESRAIQLAQELVAAAADAVAGNPQEAARTEYFIVNHRRKTDVLMVTLLFYVLWARREGAMACQPFLKLRSSPFFNDGLALVIDGFDGPFVRKRLRVHRDAILEDVDWKMRLSIMLCKDLMARRPYDEMFQSAQAFLE